MTGYMSNREWSTWKRRLTIAKKTSPEAVLSICDRFMAREDDVALPDGWALFQRAEEDAQFELRRADNRFAF